MALLGKVKLGIEQPVARFLDVTDDLSQQVAGLDKKVRVACDWTLELLFPKDVCVVHDLPHRCDPDHTAPPPNGVSSTDIKLLGREQIARSRCNYGRAVNEVHAARESDESVALISP